MKLIKITSLALLAGYLFAGSGCSKKIDEFGTINQNPGIVAEPNTAALFTNALSGVGGEAWSVTGGLYSQLYSETQYTEASRYTRLQVDFGGYYSGVLEDLVNIIDYNSNSETAGKALGNGSNANQIATARILKAWWYLRVTDAWGDIPYFQALKFNGEIPYDDQQAIYTDLFKELKEAVAQFDGGAPFKGDILMHGDIAKWKKFANSLRMIMAIRLSYVDAVKGKTEFLDAMGSSGGYLTSNADDVMLDYPGGNYSSVFYSYYNITLRSDYAISATVADHMNANGDMRINAWGSSTKGFPYGYDRNDAIAWTNAGNADWARIMNPTIRTETQPMPILTSSQVTLARAEAAQRGWTAENVNNLYESGMQLNWNQWGVYNTTDFDAYKADPDIALSGGTELEKIIRQRWFAAFPDGQEAWNIWRSTGYPVLVVAPNNGGLQIPKRFAISQNHYDLNNVNTNAVAELYKVGGEKDSQYGRPWWVKP
ncbi:MAG: SusD/RagB family nutrient-binding outer membrane lipoprotein [Chitinophagaceae bacterium]|nr:MAG: SusD/RagB family nutrient-binding outer membrane lipoprotein [Chitinophagaceae bacterium]